MKHYKVVKQVFVDEKDEKLQKIAASTISAIKENLAWNEAVALRKANKHSFIIPQHSVEPDASSEPETTI